MIMHEVNPFVSSYQRGHHKDLVVSSVHCLVIDIPNMDGNYVVLSVFLTVM